MEETVVRLDSEEARGKASFWAAELASSKKLLEKWHKRGTNIVARFIDERRNEEMFSLNLFWSNTKTLQDMLYSSLPKVEASRQHADSADDVARVAAETIERMLNLDIADNGEEYDSILRSCLQDRLLPGLGCARVRYEVETEEQEIPAQYSETGVMLAPASTETVVTWEDAPIEYYHWQDVLWGWGRSFAELPWIAFRAYLSRAEMEERFGASKAKNVQYRKQKAADTETDVFSSDEDNSPWQKAEVWEIWDKISGKVFWYGVGSPSLLDVKTDPLELRQFFPCPPFLIANATTALYRPTPDYYLAQDLYNEVDRLQQRIQTITQAVKVVGVYDAQSDGIQRMLTEGVENDLIPIDSWAMFAESGGLKGKIDWLPILDVVNTLDKLRQLRDETIQLLQQVTGMSDIMRGSLASPYEGVGQSQMKAQFGSVRVQALQDQFAQFAADLLQLKAEVICKHFEPQTIIDRSNMQFSHDADLLPQAVALLKQPNMAYVRIKVRPETVAMVDYARLKVERTEFVTAIATFMQSAAPLIQQDKNTLPYLIKIMQWSMAGFKGSQEIEGILDKAVEDSVKRLQQEQGNDDPEQQKEQAKLQGELQKIQAKSQADMQLRQADSQADLQSLMANHQARMAEIAATHESKIAEIQQKLQADLIKEQTALQGDLMQIQSGAEAEMQKENATTQLGIVSKAEQARIELDKEAEKTRMKMAEIAAQSLAKLREMKGHESQELDSD